MRKKIEIKGNFPNLRILLVESSLGLEDVVVVAKENTSLSSSSKIENAAIEHVQPTNLSDIMQLVPGQITLNPEHVHLKTKLLSGILTQIRLLTTTVPWGTAIIIDGTPVNNDANMQTLNTASGGVAESYSTVGQGIDLRNISTDNIESVEVIRGIPSVAYGDLTTGAVLVKTKARENKTICQNKS